MSNKVTDHQMRVIELLCVGKSNLEIAKILGIKEKSVVWHLTNIKKKYGLKNSRQIISIFNNVNSPIRFCAMCGEKFETKLIGVDLGIKSS